MKVLFAVSNEEVSENIVKKYQKEYKEIISYKNVYYFNAILKELQKDKTYDRVVISEDLETFTHNQYDQIDKFIFEKLDSISDEASNYKGDDIPIILICSDRRAKSEQMLVKLFGIGIYNALLGTDRSIEELCKLINKPRLKKEAKVYYKIDTEDVRYAPENENDVSEVELQNILAHYKKLGKNEDKYVESFDNIAEQYNDIQLKIICKFLPLNVRAVLEEKSPKYQKLMAFNMKVSDDLRKKGPDKEKQGTSQKLLVNNDKKEIFSKPVVIPNAVNMEKGVKLSKHKEIEQEDALQQIEREINTYVKRENEFVKQPKSIEQEENKKEIQEELQEEQPVKRRRGRPKKNNEEILEEQPKKKRGRPRKVTQEEPVELEEKNTEEDEDIVMPGFEEINEPEQEVMMPGFEEVNEPDEDVVMPGFEEINEPEHKKIEESEELMMPGLEETQYQQPIERQTYRQIQQPQMVTPISRIEQTEIADVDISQYLTPDKKIACFVGTSKNGTSFIVNNIAEVLSTYGVSTAILDITQNRNAYYIYTNNEEELRNTAIYSIQNLVNGIAKGVRVNRSLDVYTSLPGENQYISRAGEILETLIKNYSVVLIDCDFQSPISYFSYAQEIYLVQSLDVLTIQPLTAFLRELKAKNVLEESKLRIVLNKFEKLRGVNEKVIIEGMSSYNDPSMSYMVDLFDKNLIRYICIPFDEQVYVKYLQGLIDCKLTLKGYPKNIIQILTELANMIYPIDNGKASGKSTYRPPALNSKGFTPTINSTLEQMRKY